jgi:hypothetical protein
MSCEFILSISLSALSLAGTAFVYFTHQRKLDKQQYQINQYSLEKSTKDREKEKKAFIEANACELGKKWILKIYNKGDASAHNIRLKSDDIENDDNIFMPIEDGLFPYPKLSPKTSIELPIHLFYGNKPYYKIVFTWDDDFGKDRVNEQTISF